MAIKGSLVGTLCMFSLFGDAGKIHRINQLIFLSILAAGFKQLSEWSIKKSNA